MQDVLYIAVMAGFFALCVGFVKLCERIVGPDLALETASESAGSETASLKQERVA